MVKHPWPLLEISLSDFRRLATLNMITYLPTYLPTWNNSNLFNYLILTEESDATDAIFLPLEHIQNK